MDAQQIKQAVRETYGQVATRADGGGQRLVPAANLGYGADKLAVVPDGADLGLGCGAPLEFAALRPGETVLDLGSGAGFDAFIAGRAVGPEGRVIGVDMTPEMVAKARANAVAAGADNLDFRLGEIEHLPVESDSVDLVISNCVLNLVPDKDRAFAEIVRVLRPGGRLCVSDIVTQVELPEALRSSAASLAACVGGAIDRDDYLAKLRTAGLVEVEVAREVEARDLIASADCCGSDELLEHLKPGMVASITVRGRKPVG